MQRARWTSVVVAAALALALGGCGQNDGSGDASDPSSVPPAVPPPVTGLMPPPITPPATPAPSSAGAGAGAASAGTGGAGGMAAMPAVPTDAGVGGVVGGMGGSGMGVAGSVAPGAAPLTIEITARAIPAGGENHVCVVLPLPNAEPAWVTSMHATLSAGSHHLIVDRRPAGTTTDSEASPCSPTMGGDSTRLMIAQQRETTLDMPAGTGLPIAAHQPVFLQLHYINLEESTADIVGTFEVVLSDPAAAPPIEVQSVFTGATSLDIPNGEMSMGEYFMTLGGGSAKPWHVFAVTSHTHSLGIRATIERVASANAPDSTPIHESLDWHEPPLTRLEPELLFEGDDGLRLRCYYQNDTGRDVGFGTRFEDEMCFLWLYYYEQ